MGAKIRRQITNTNTGTSCNSDKASQFMTPARIVLRLLIGQRDVWAYLHLLLKNDTLTSEICWTVKAITSHYSYKSCENVGNIFQFMFPDSHKHLHVLNGNLPIWLYLVLQHIL